MKIQGRRSGANVTDTKASTAFRKNIDWYEVDGSDIKVCIIPDDLFRKVLAGGEP